MTGVPQSQFSYEGHEIDFHAGTAAFAAAGAAATVVSAKEASASKEF